MEGRLSDSPYVEMIWRGQAGANYDVICPADERWHLLMIRENGRVKVSAEGPINRARPTVQNEGAEFLVIQFQLGVYMPFIPVTTIVNRETILPSGAGQSFWLKDATWQYPDYENADTFAERLLREEVIVVDPIVKAIMEDREPDVSSRTIRRRFLRATGLTPKTIQQIERARLAMSQLEQGAPILDVVYDLGYSDQPHLTRSLKHFIGYTPAQILQMLPI